MKEKQRGWSDIYEVHLSLRTQKFFDKLDKHIQDRVKKRLQKLGTESVPSDSKFISRDKYGDKIFRYRIGGFRALYKVKENKKIVLITKLDKRPRVFDRM